MHVGVCVCVCVCVAEVCAGQSAVAGPAGNRSAGQVRVYKAKTLQGGCRFDSKNACGWWAGTGVLVAGAGH